MKNISVVIPLFNEHESIAELVQKIFFVCDREAIQAEVILVDDGSRDGSLQECERLYEHYPEKLQVISFRRNYGKSAALRCGIEQARGEVIITMDADLQDDPEAIIGLLAKINEGYDLVSGWKKKRHDPLSKTLPSKLFNSVVSFFSGIKLHDFNCGLKAYRADCAKSLDIYGERHRFLPVLAHWNGFSVTELVVTHHARKYGKSKFGIERLTNGLFDLLTLLFLRRYLKKPLHFFGLLGLFCIVTGASILGYFGVNWIQTGHMHIRPLILFGVGAIIVGIQFISIGLIGEMISQNNPGVEYQLKRNLLPASDKAKTRALS